jgi:hypothetical protein
LPPIRRPVFLFLDLPRERFLPNRPSRGARRLCAATRLPYLIGVG